MLILPPGPTMHRILIWIQRTESSGWNCLSCQLSRWSYTLYTFFGLPFCPLIFIATPHGYWVFSRQQEGTVPWEWSMEASKTEKPRKERSGTSDQTCLSPPFCPGEAYHSVSPKVPVSLQRSVKVSFPLYLSKVLWLWKQHSFTKP